MKKRSLAEVVDVDDGAEGTFMCFANECDANESSLGKNELISSVCDLILCDRHTDRVHSSQNGQYRLGGHRLDVFDVPRIRDQSQQWAH